MTDGRARRYNGTVMKNGCFRIINIVLCLLIVFTAACRNVRAEDSDTQGGKHNAEVGVDPIGKDEGYSAVLYNNLNGLPTSEANDIVETSDGFIWIGSYSGLIRYDGSSFERLDSTSGLTSVKCLYVDSKDRLWIGTNNNGIAMMEKGKVRMWGMEEGLKSPSIRSIVEGSQGWIYVATTQGLIMFDNDLRMSYMEDPRVTDVFLHDLRIGKDGTIYVVTNDGDVLMIWSGVVYQHYTFKDTWLKGVNCICPDPENSGMVYLETLDSVVYHGVLDSTLNNLEKVDVSPLKQIQVFEYIDGDLWICARNGVGVLNETGFHLLENVPMNNSVGHVMTDYEGNLWFTSTRQGVMKIVKNRFIDLFERFNVSQQVVNSTCMYEGKLFAATDSGLMIFDEEGPMSEYPLASAKSPAGEDLGFNDLLAMLQGVRIRSIIRDSKDRLWISTWMRYGLLRYDHGDLTAFTAADGLFSDSIRAIDECQDGSILVAATGGVNVIQDDLVTGSYGEEQGVENTEVLSVCAGMNGDILIGSDGGGIFIVSDEGTRNISYKDGLTSGSIMKIRHDEDHHVFWIVTGDSLSYMNEEYELTNITHFPYSNNFDVCRNGRNELWVLSSNGIYVADIDELLENKEDMKAYHYGMSNGLPCIATANSYSELSENGDLYIAGTTGIALTNIEAPFENVSNLKAAVPYVDVDGINVFPDEEGKFVLPHDFTKLAIHAHVYTYSLVEPKVSIRLEPFDKYSNTGNIDDVTPAYYTNLPGGNYEFIMELLDSMGHVSKTVSVQIVKEKAFYEEPWFYVVSSLAAVFLIFDLVRAYVNRKLQLQEKRHREEEEKKRITGELSMAASIQQSMLPHIFPPFPDRKEFDIYALMDPAKDVGGDFYDFFMIDEDHLCLVMADVSGKGIPGALFMMSSKIILKSYAESGMSPAETLTKANETICASNQAGMFVTVWIGILEISTGRLTAANAGHEYPVIKYPGRGFEILKDRHGFVVGGMEDVAYHEYELSLEPGSKLFLYTDGIPEATDSKNQMFGIDRMVAALNEDPDAGVEEIILGMRDAVNRFVKDAEQFDDVTMLALEYKGK